MSRDTASGAELSACQWTLVGGVFGCAPLDIDEVSKALAAAAADEKSSDECTPKEKDYTPLGAVLGALLVILLCTFAWMWYRQNEMSKASRFDMYANEVEEEVQTYTPYVPVMEDGRNSL